MKHLTTHWTVTPNSQLLSYNSRSFAERRIQFWSDECQGRVHSPGDLCHLSLAHSQSGFYLAQLSTGKAETLCYAEPMKEKKIWLNRMVMALYQETSSMFLPRLHIPVEKDKCISTRKPSWQIPYYWYYPFRISVKENKIWRSSWVWKLP